MDPRPMAPPFAEARMIEPDALWQLRQLREQGWGTKRIARELGVAHHPPLRAGGRQCGAAGATRRPSARRRGAEAGDSPLRR